MDAFEFARTTCILCAAQAAEAAVSMLRQIEVGRDPSQPAWSCARLHEDAYVLVSAERANGRGMRRAEFERPPPPPLQPMSDSGHTERIRDRDVSRALSTLTASANLLRRAARRTTWLPTACSAQKKARGRAQSRSVTTTTARRAAGSACWSVPVRPEPVWTTTIVPLSCLFVLPQMYVGYDVNFARKSVLHSRALHSFPPHFKCSNRAAQR